MRVKGEVVFMDMSTGIPYLQPKFEDSEASNQCVVAVYQGPDFGTEGIKQIGENSLEGDEKAKILKTMMKITRTVQAMMRK